MTRLPRCIRLNYAGDFHLDIVPAVPDPEAGGSCILVPDLDADLAFDHPKNDRWKPSNPLGYQVWFGGRCVRHRAKYALEANVAPFPDQEDVEEKPALKRAVQLFKRWRDKEFRQHQHLAPPSIILTTLCGHLYLGEPWCTDALQTILNRIVALLDSGERICLKNPAHDKEDICEKWERDPKSFQAFDRAIRRFRERWERLLKLSGIDDIGAELTDLFEDEPGMPVKKAVEEYARRRVGNVRDRGKLLMERHTGRIGAAVGAGSISVPTHTYFGDAKRSA